LTFFWKKNFFNWNKKS